MRFPARTSIATALLLTACSTGVSARPPSSGGSTTGTSAGSTTGTSVSTLPRKREVPPDSVATRPAGTFTINFAGDVHFMGRTAARLAADPTTVFGEAQPALAAADLTMVNLETAITTRGTPQAKEYHFRTNPTALAALKDAGVDVVTMANNHAADYGAVGLQDTVAAIKASGMPVLGIGADAKQAFAPYETTINGTKVAIFAADDVNDETTLRLFSAGPHTAGVANARDDTALLVAEVRAAVKAGYAVIVYLHWGTEDVICMNRDQQALADRLAAAGATAIIGSHPHALQGAGWRTDGVYVAYSLGDYLWWKADQASEYDTALLTLTFDHGKVVAQHWAPAEIDDRGVPMPATGAAKRRIEKIITDSRACAPGVSATPRA